MTTAIANLPSLAEIGATALSADIVASLTRTGDFLDRIQLFQGTSSVAKQGKIPPGQYGIPRNDDVEVLGASVDVLILAARAKALDTSGDTPVAAYDAASAEFIRIKTQADTVQDSGCMHGLEFLLIERTTGNFYTYFANTASARREAGKLVPTTGVKPMTLSAEYVEKGKWTWHAPVYKACSAAFANLPPVDKIKAQVDKFNNPQASNGGAEEVKKDEAAGKRRSR
jgi:hypothetical protein